MQRPILFLPDVEKVVDFRGINLPSNKPTENNDGSHNGGWEGITSHAGEAWHSTIGTMEGPPPCMRGHAYRGKYPDGTKGKFPSPLKLWKLQKRPTTTMQAKTGEKVRKTLFRMRLTDDNRLS